MSILDDANIGARPGTLGIKPDAPEPLIRVTQYDTDNVEAFDVDDVATLPSSIKRETLIQVGNLDFGNEEKPRRATFSEPVKQTEHARRRVVFSLVALS